MDFEALSNDELAAAGAGFFQEVERRLEAAGKEELVHLTHMAHRALNRVRRKLVEGGHVQPLSGGIPKDE